MKNIFLFLNTKMSDLLDNLKKIYNYINKIITSDIDKLSFIEYYIEGIDYNNIKKLYENNLFSNNQCSVNNIIDILCDKKLINTWLCIYDTVMEITDISELKTIYIASIDILFNKNDIEEIYEILDTLLTRCINIYNEENNDNNIYTDNTYQFLRVYNHMCYINNDAFINNKSEIIRLFNIFPNLPKENVLKRLSCFRTFDDYIFQLKQDLKNIILLILQSKYDKNTMKNFPYLSILSIVSIKDNIEDMIWSNVLK